MNKVFLLSAFQLFSLAAFSDDVVVCTGELFDTPRTNCSVKLTVVNEPVWYNGRFVYPGPRMGTTDVTGCFTFTNPVPAQYQLTFGGDNPPAPVRLVVTGTNGTVNAGQILSTALISSGANVSYSVTASDARFITLPALTNYVSTNSGGIPAGVLTNGSQNVSFSSSIDLAGGLNGDSWIQQNNYFGDNELSFGRNFDPSDPQILFDTNNFVRAAGFIGDGRGLTNLTATPDASVPWTNQAGNVTLWATNADGLTIYGDWRDQEHTMRFHTWFPQNNPGLYTDGPLSQCAATGANDRYWAAIQSGCYIVNNDVDNGIRYMGGLNMYGQSAIDIFRRVNGDATNNFYGLNGNLTFSVGKRGQLNILTTPSPNTDENEWFDNRPEIVLSERKYIYSPDGCITNNQWAIRGTFTNLTIGAITMGNDTLLPVGLTIGTNGVLAGNGGGLTGIGWASLPAVPLTNAGQFVATVGGVASNLWATNVVIYGGVQTNGLLVVQKDSSAMAAAKIIGGTSATGPIFRVQTSNQVDCVTVQSNGVVTLATNLTVGGTITGNGSGLTNLNATNLYGIIPATSSATAQVGWLNKQSNTNSISHNVVLTNFDSFTGYGNVTGNAASGTITNGVAGLYRIQFGADWGVAAIANLSLQTNGVSAFISPNYAASVLPNLQGSRIVSGVCYLYLSTATVISIKFTFPGNTQPQQLAYIGIELVGRSY